MKNVSIATKMNLPWVESPFFYDLLREKNLTPEQREMVMHYNREGFLVLKQAVSHELIDRTLGEIKNDYPARLGEEPNRHQDLWKKYSTVRDLASLPQILNTLQFLYDREPIPFQTLNFKFGTQQRPHSDSIHFSSTPARFMAGVWVALEATDANNGPLFYYPRSHRQKEFNYFDLGIEAQENFAECFQYEGFMEEFMETNGYEWQEIHMEKGDALIWSANLVHGGMPIKGENRTRWSQVTHYYFEGCMYYSPRLSDMFTGNLNLRHIVNIATGKVVQHSENGKPITTINTGKHTGQYRYAVSHKFTIPILMKEIMKKLIGRKTY